MVMYGGGGIVYENFRDPKDPRSLVSTETRSPGSSQYDITAYRDPKDRAKARQQENEELAEAIKQWEAREAEKKLKRPEEKPEPKPEKVLLSEFVTVLGVYDPFAHLR
jgi:hypothetical protein